MNRQTNKSKENEQETESTFCAETYRQEVLSFAKGMNDRIKEAAGVKGVTIDRRPSKNQWRFPTHAGIFEYRWNEVSGEIFSQKYGDKDWWPVGRCYDPKKIDEVIGLLFRGIDVEPDKKKSFTEIARERSKRW